MTSTDAGLRLDAEQTAVDLQEALSLLLRRLRQTRPIADLAPPETQALASLLRSAPMTSAELARLEGITPQSASVTVGGLERRGLVARHRDPDDGRRQLLELTAAGRRRARDKQDARVEQLAAALAAEFTDAEQAALWAASPLLARLAAALPVTLPPTQPMSGRSS